MADRFDKFTERARRTLTLAQEEAQRFGQRAIGTEHLLLGLLREGDGIAARVLNALGVSLPQVRSAVEDRIGRGAATTEDIGLTAGAKKVIELAVDEARRLNHHYIGTEHLLLGLVREGRGIAAEVLEGLGISLETLRAQVIYALSHGGRQRFEAASAPDAPPDLKAALRGLEALRQDLDDAIRAQDFDRATTLRDQERELVDRIARLERAWRQGRDDPSEATPPVDFERFTEGARRVLALAQEEAQRFNHNYIGTEHLLLGLTRAPDERAGRLLDELGVQLPRVRSAVEFIIGRGETMSMGQIGLTPRAKRVLVLAVAEARQLGDLSIDTTHLLLGLIAEGQGIAAGVMESMGLNVERVRARVLAARAGLAGGAGVVATIEHRFGASVRAIPARLDGGERPLSFTVGVSLRELDLYERGFEVHLTLTVTGPMMHPPDLVATATDERGGRYDGSRGGASGAPQGVAMVWREHYAFTPALDPTARELTLTFALGRRRGPAIEADADAPTWTFVVPLPAEE